MPQHALVSTPCAPWPNGADNPDGSFFPGERDNEAGQQAEQIRHVLRKSGYWALRTIGVSARGQVVVLEGRVPCFYLKQLAQAAALGILGVRELRNEVTVCPAAP